MGLPQNKDEIKIRDKKASIVQEISDQLLERQQQTTVRTTELDHSEVMRI